jgi:hypothetical protein
MSDEKWNNDLSHEMERELKKVVTAYCSHSCSPGAQLASRA